MTTALVIGGGPAGLMAAERLSAAGCAVTLHERMPSLGRKLLMAGRGGLNLTHSEPWETFVTRYAEATPWLKPALDGFTSQNLIAWCEGLGQPTFVGASGRVFPKTMKASPLLRAWIGRLIAQGVRFQLRSRWTGWAADGALTFEGADGAVTDASADIVILAGGGASWPRLGSDGSVAAQLAARGVETRPFRPANVGANVGWTEPYRTAFAGKPLKSCAFTVGNRRVRGEAVITGYGLEGGAIYSLGPPLRAALDRDGTATLWIDLKPDMTHDALIARLMAQPAHQSQSNRLRKATGLPPEALQLMREARPQLARDAISLAKVIKGAPLTVTGLQSLERAISSAGGVAAAALDGRLMLTALRGVFCAGEMLDWEAPTGGYLLQACLATGLAAADGALAWKGDAWPVGFPAQGREWTL